MDKAAQNPIGSASDIWSLGKTMICLMNFRNDNEEFTYDHPIEGPALANFVPPGFPANLRLLVGRCLEKVAKDRLSVERLRILIQREVEGLKQGGRGEGEMLEFRRDVYERFARA